MELLWIIPLALIVALILAALVPLRVNFRLSTSRSVMLVRYGPFNLINTEISKQQKRPAQETKAEMSGAKKKRPRRPRRPWRSLRRFEFRGVWEKFTQALNILPGFGKAALNFAGRIFRKTELTEFSGRVAGGLGDPALTGMAAGWVYSLFGALPRLGKHIAFEPDYMADWPVIEISGKASFRPIAAALPALQFVREAPLAGMYRLWRPSKAKKKSK